MAKPDDDLPILPKKTAGKKLVPEGRRPSPPMLRLMRIARAIGILLGGFVTIVGLMSVVGIVTDMFWVRLGIAVLVGIALPALAADRVLKRTNMGGGLATVVDVFAIVLLLLAIVFVGLGSMTAGILRDEGDRYARSGSKLMARAVYFLAGVSPTFPGEPGYKVAKDIKPRGPDAGAPLVPGTDGGAK